MQIHSVVFALSRQINEQKVRKNNNLLCAANNFFLISRSRVFFNPEPPPPLRTPLMPRLRRTIPNQNVG